MPPKKTTSVKFVKTSSNKPTKKRKKKSSSDEEQTVSKKRRSEELKNKLVRISKTKVLKPISEGVLQHLESLINSAILSVVSKKRTLNFELVQTPLSHLKQMLIQHLRKIKCVSGKLENMKNLKKELAEEQRKLDNNQETLKALNNEVEKAVEQAESIEDSTLALTEKLNSLTEKTAVINRDPLELPKATFEAPTFQENAKKLKNPKAVLKELSLMQSNRVYKDLHKLIEKSYAEISTATQEDI